MSICDVLIYVVVVVSVTILKQVLMDMQAIGNKTEIEN